MLSPKQRFKIAFLALCADQGLTLSETHDLVKTACEGLEKRGQTFPSKLYTTPAWALKKLFRGLMWGAGVGAPTGALLGHVGAKMTSAFGDETPEEVKNREIIEELNRQAQAARFSVLLRERQQTTKRRGRALV